VGPLGGPGIGARVDQVGDHRAAAAAAARGTGSADRPGLPVIGIGKVSLGSPPCPVRG